MAEAATTNPQPLRPRRRGLLLGAMIVAIAIVGGTMVVAAQRDCVTKWNAVLYRPDDIGALSACVRNATMPVR